MFCYTGNIPNILMLLGLIANKKTDEDDEYARFGKAKNTISCINYNNRGVHDYLILHFYGSRTNYHRPHLYRSDFRCLDCTFYQRISKSF